MAFSSGEDALGWFMTWCGFYDSLRQLDKPCVIALNGVAADSVPPMYSLSRWISLRTWLHSGRIRGGYYTVAERYNSSHRLFDLGEKGVYSSYTPTVPISASPACTRKAAPRTYSVCRW
jgi:hypothetical protein